MIILSDWRDTIPNEESRRRERKRGERRAAEKRRETSAGREPRKAYIHKYVQVIIVI